MTAEDYRNGQLLNFHASQNFERGDRVLRTVGAAPMPPGSTYLPGGSFSSQNIAGTLTAGASWVRLGVALIPLLFGKKKK